MLAALLFLLQLLIFLLQVSLYILQLIDQGPVLVGLSRLIALVQMLISFL